MTSFQRLASLALASLSLSACGGGESDVVANYLAGLDAYAVEVCQCEYATLAPLIALHKPYTSVDECVADFPTNSAERGCVEGLFKDETVDYSAVLDCRADAEHKAANCLSALTCTDTARTGCYDQARDDITACPDLPDSVESKLTDCLYN